MAEFSLCRNQLSSRSNEFTLSLNSVIINVNDKDIKRISGRLILADNKLVAIRHFYQGTATLIQVMKPYYKAGGRVPQSFSVEIH